ncbi:uncharacterized protein LOC121384811 [Gigantopelta aegis]|uniref:uncharacterized protein LOC121384811 n=1 Tax=Gigantopelta aegis TaxID=1735272 RepID=UPI001B88D616|nr:uncharacterized protein LOC121384811 [Gigantopelta aegis]
MSIRRPGDLFPRIELGGQQLSNSSVNFQNVEDFKQLIVKCKETITDDGTYEEKIVTDSRSLKDDVNGNMITVDEDEEEEEDPEAGLDTSQLLVRAQKNLEYLDLAEAERLFLKTYKHLQDKPEANDHTLIDIHFGLAEVCTRKSRTSRHSPLEWLWLCIHATTLLQEAIEMCATEMVNEKDNKRHEYYKGQRVWAENRCHGLRDVIARTIHTWLKQNWEVIDPASAHNTLGQMPSAPYRFSVSNLLGIVPRQYQSQYLSQAFSMESLHDTPLSQLVNAGNANWFKRILFYCHRRLSSNNVKEIMEETLNHKVTGSDIGSSDPQIESLESLATSDTGNYSDIDVDDKAKLDSPVKEHSLAFELAAGKVDTSGWSFFLEERKTFEVEGITELVSQAPARLSEESEESEEQLDCPADSESEPSAVVDEVKVLTSPVLERPIKLTIAKVFHKVVSRLLEENEFQKAELLTEEVLEIVDNIQDGTVRMLRFSAQLMQNIGLLCLRQGDMCKGMINLENALGIFRDLQDHEAHREVSLVLIDIGNAYVFDVLSEDALHNEIINAVREFFEREASDDTESGESSPENMRSQELPTPAKNVTVINEAIRCYRESLSVLENSDEKQIHLVAKAVMKLGDCHFVLKEYPEALDCYERAMQYFRASMIHGKESLSMNAHVLCMLGVSTFMLHVYPRSAHVFELALMMVRQLQRSHGVTHDSFLRALLHSLLGISYYKMKTYHKCVSMCYQAFEIFWNLYEESMPNLTREKFWIICQNLYILGNSYNVLNLQHKAIKYLNVGRELMKMSKVREKRQFMRILQILGDCYFAQYDYKTALVYYNEALEFGDHAADDLAHAIEQQTISDIEADIALNRASEDMALHNQLLSRSADAHISMKQYQNAVHYLEQARDIQDVLEDDIKGDLVSTLYTLGQMHSIAGDVDKAIDSYKESLEVYRELHDGGLGPEMCTSLGNLATMCYVKACICESIDQELEMILAAEQYFQDAIAIEIQQSVCVKYANFLYSQGNYDDAIMYLEDSLKRGVDPEDIVFGGLEKVTLPDPLQDEVDAQEEVIMPSTSLARLILILSHKMMHRTKEASNALLDLMEEVYDSDIPFLWSVLGYAMMEMQLFEEAANMFATAHAMDPFYNLALDNYCMCLCIMALKSFQNAFAAFFIHYKIWYENPSIPDFAKSKV